MDNLTFHLGVKEQEENVHVDDFIVVVQTEFYCHLMQKFANKGICCDSTHGKNISHIASVHISKSKSLSI